MLYMPNVEKVQRHFMFEYQTAKKRGTPLSEIKGSINAHYKTLTYSYVKKGERIVVTNNERNSKDYTKEEKILLHNIKMATNGKKLKKDIYQPFLTDWLDNIPVNKSIEVDRIYRKYSILPAAEHRQTDEPLLEEISNYQYVEFSGGITEIDINKCYIAALSNRKLYIPDDTTRTYYSDIKSAQEYFKERYCMLYVSVMVNEVDIKDPDLMPIAQPTEQDEDELTYALHSGTTIVPSPRCEVRLVSVHDQNNNINELEYFLKRHKFTKLTYTEIFTVDFTEKTFELSPQLVPLINQILNTLKHNKELRLVGEIKHDLSMIVGKSFPKAKTEGGFKYELTDPEKGIFTLVERDSDPETKVNNKITITPYLYALINQDIRQRFGVIPYRKILKLTADAIFISNDTYEEYKQYFKLGVDIGEYKIKQGPAVRFYNNKSWVMYDNQKLIAYANGGFSNKIMPYLSDFNAWLNRKKLNYRYRNKSLNEVVKLELYNNKIEKVENQYDYRVYPLFKGNLKEKMILLADQGCGKTTAVMRDLTSRKSIKALHLFYNKVPQETTAKEVRNLIEDSRFEASNLAEFIHQVNESRYDVRTFDSFFIEEYYVNTGSKRLRGRPNYNAFRKWAIDNIEKIVEDMQIYNIIVIDEVQSLFDDLREFFIKIVNHPKIRQQIILLGDFNQQFQKIYRDKTPLTCDDLPNWPIYTLNINYRNTLDIYEKGSEIISSGTKCASKSTGNITEISVTTLKEIAELVNDIPATDTAFICRTQNMRTKLRIAGCKQELLSVAQSLSTSPKNVVLLESTFTAINEDLYEAAKEIRCGIMRAKESLTIINLERRIL